MDTKIRSLAKGLSWRIAGTIATTFLVLILSHDLKLSLTVGFLESIIKIMIFYGHERAWEKISWGKK